MEPDKLLLLGIDGATWDVIDPLIAGGKLPNLKKLKEAGVSGPLESTVIPNTPPAWISFLTGKNPGKTGIFDFLGRQENTYDLKVNTSLDNREPTLFHILSRAGRKVCSVNMPMTYPPEKINGSMISGIPVPPAARDICHPVDLIREIEQEVGGYVVDIDYSKYDAQQESGGQGLDRYESLLGELYRALELRQKAVLHLLKSGEFEVFAVVYSIVDRVQHYFWKFIDTSHPGYTEEGALRFGDAIEKAYEAVDEKIGELLDAAPDCRVVVMSDHGFGPYYRDFHLNRWLFEKGYLQMKKIPRLTLRRTNIGNVLRKVKLGFVSDLLPRRFVRLPVPRLYRKTAADSQDIIWKGTRAYAGVLGVCVNLKGREPEGVVSGGEEYRKLTQEIIRDLLELRDDRSGEKLIDEADVKENRFYGPKTALAADVYFRIAGLSYNITTRLGTEHMFGDRTQFGMSGTHRMNGIFIIKSEGILQGTRLENASIMDIPPTVLHILGHPILNGMDGKVLEQAFNDDYLSTRPVRYIDEELLEPVREGTVYTKEEEEEIRDLLKGLGYLN